MNIAIIVITYNRYNSIKRLLNSLALASYTSLDIPLIISVDFEASEGHTKVIDFVDSFDWVHGEKRVIKHTQNMGLRNHVLSCGSLSNNYDAIIMLEDDLFVSPEFYNYTVQMLSSYRNQSYIAGISLYSHERNTNIGRSFSPVKNDFDVFFLQYAQSWGQCFTKEMWHAFHLWYEDHVDWNINDSSIPSAVANWPSSSWLKYFIKYVIVSDKYFVYPYTSLTTNFQDAGTHAGENTNICQVDLSIYSREYRTPKLDDAIIYDAFFERSDKAFIDTLHFQDICIDIYGSKKEPIENRYWLTMKRASYKVVKTYGLDLRPHELNISLNNEGKDIFLYDTKTSELNTQAINAHLIFSYDYNKGIPTLGLLKHLLHIIIKKTIKIAKFWN